MECYQNLEFHLKPIHHSKKTDQKQAKKCLIECQGIYADLIQEELFTDMDMDMNTTQYENYKRDFAKKPTYPYSLIGEKLYLILGRVNKKTSKFQTSSSLDPWEAF